MGRAFHPVIFAFYPVLFLYSRNTDITSFEVAAWPLVIALAGGAVLWLLAYLASRNAAKSALFVSLFVFLFFAFGHLHTYVHRWVLDMGFYFGKKEHAEFILKGRISLGLVFISVVLLGLAAWRLFKARAETTSVLTVAANVMALVLLAMPILTLVFASFTRDAESASVRAAQVTTESGLVARLGYKPDIYNIVLDGYGRKDTLKEFYSFDNQEFLTFLEEKGFVIAPNSRANYNWTMLSLASFLNMKYINELTEDVGIDSRNRARPFVMTRDNAIARFLGTHGYRFVHLQSSWGSTMMNPYADEQISCRGGVFQEDFYRVLLNSSALKMWEPSVGVGLAECHLNNLATLEKIGPTQGPKFVFVHFVPPHHPYVFDRDGNVLRQATVSNQFEWQKRLWGDRDLYLGQMHYMNTRIRGVIEAILATSENPPIIVLHSDHGPQILEGEERTEGRDYNRARYANLATFYLPGANESLIPPDITLVNVYRTILNEYFDAGFEILDNHYFRSEYLRPYDFAPVTFNE
ncbi:MAG: hypothetical protein A2289_03700 [Deltaproteobacteria bacterium RIFOXYA12_FULL_58_15]|nr:MAG: hypothetical protein A2289_03700 [Deltaproteobacteria bacterium RIFOXYA12_FULL_58_15]OGR08488.1 MAG: hypothetical protein A2341_02945 [Deltaproteobacteria bacterium RIFOXYB12_FULL_58_9]